MGYDQH
jgi:hypothetical protein